MAAGSVTVAALRHRPRQAVLVVVLAAVVTGAAALGPLYARAVEQSVVRNVVDDAPPASSTLVVTDRADPPASPVQLARTVRGAVPPQFGAPIGGAEAPVQLDPAGAGEPVRTRLTSRDGLCRHVTVSAGRCPRAAGELLVSGRTAATVGLRPGTAVTLRGAAEADGSRISAGATVVGVYDLTDTSGRYWAGRGAPPPVARAAAEEQSTVAVDDVFTVWATLGAQPWPDLTTHLDIPLLASRIDLQGLETVRAATAAVDERAGTVGGSAASSIGPLLDSTIEQREQSRSVIPLLAVQLAVLGIVVLAFVCAAATEQRRPEIALARLRGHGSRGAAVMLLRELGVLVLAGAVIGTALGWLTAVVSAELWLQPGVTVEARWPVGGAVLASLVAGLLAILAAGTPTLRQPLTSLLRRVPPRASALQVGLVEGAVVAAAAAGVVTLLTGDGGPIALLAPGLLAVAGGLLLAQATIPTAGPLARLALRRGRLPWALAGLQIARRPALRRLIAIITVACALLVFAVDAWTVAGRNRTARAEVEAGAPVVLGVDANSPQALRDAVLDIDPKGRFATPVVTVSSVTQAGPRTTAVEPAAFARIANWAGAAGVPKADDLAQLRPPPVAPVRLTGDRVEAQATVTAEATPIRGAPLPDLAPIRLVLGVETQDGLVHPVSLGVTRSTRTTYRAAVPCTDGCLLRTVTLARTFGDFVDASVKVVMSRLSAGTGTDLTPVDLDPKTPDGWQPLPLPGDAFGDASVLPGPALVFGGNSYGPPLTVQRADRPTLANAITAGDLPKPLSTNGITPVGSVVGPDLLGGQVVFQVVGTVPQIPRAGTRALLVDLAGVATGPVAGAGTTSYDVWLASDDPARERTLRRQLAAHGLRVTARDTTGAHAVAFESEGPSLALRLSLLAGLVSVLLAGATLVVGVATSGVNRARDLAGLRLVGVPARTVRQASVREHLVVAVLGVLAGTALGLVAAQAALPDIPLFATPNKALPLVLSPAWTAVALTALGCLLLLCTVSVAVGRALAHAAVPARLQEGR
jgi:putative ABC transport system permease protein